MEDPTAGDYEVRRWLTPAQVRALDFSAYWNDEAAERRKEWWTLDGDFSRMEEYVDDASTLGRQLADALALAPPTGEGADLAAGTLWAVPRLLAAGAQKVYAVEFSEHRLLQIGPTVLRHYGVGSDQVVLCVGSFSALALPDSRLDFVLLSQALHHASNPHALLAEVGRVLAPGGVAYAIGEPFPRTFRWARRVAARAGFRRASLVDPLLGDHVYSRAQYDEMFRRARLSLEAMRAYRDGVSFVLRLES